jgi:hypothetical protein
MRKIENYKSRILLLIFPVLMLCSFQSEKDRLVWNESRLLSWNDFNGKPEKRFAAASTHYDILKHTAREGNKAVVTIEAVFFKNMSWKKMNWVNDEVLTHEQKHFDIVELYARKLRKAVFETHYTDYNDLLSKLEMLYDRNDKEMDKYQDLYDEESDGSMNGEKQREWNKRVIQELENYRKFKDAVVTVYISQD